MGLFDFLKRNNIKKLQAPDTVIRDGTSLNIKFSPNSDWSVKTKDEKQDALKMYPLSHGEILLNIEIPKEDKVQEVNLLKFRNTDEILDIHPGKAIKSLVIKLLDQQTKAEYSILNKNKVVNTYTDLGALLKSRGIQGTLSSEGKDILGNFIGRDLNIDRTVFLNRDKDGYLEDYFVDDKLRVINKVLNLPKEDNSKLDVSQYSKRDIKDFRNGYIALCRLANNIGIGDRVVKYKPGSVQDSYDDLLNTRLGEGLNSHISDKDRKKLKDALNQELIASSLFLEDILEEYTISIREKYNANEVVDNSNSAELEKENTELITIMLRYSKTEFTKEELENPDKKSFDERIRVELENNGTDIDLANVDISGLVKLVGCKNYKAALSRFSDEELETIAQLARDELQRRKLEREETKRTTEDQK